MMPFSRGRRMEMGLCVRQQSIPEKLIPLEAENGREQKKRGKCRGKMDRSMIQGRSSAIFSFGREVMPFPVAGGAETEAGSSD